MQTLKELSDLFVSSPAYYPDHALPVYQRWGLVIGWLPSARGGLHHDHSLVYAEAVRSMDPRVVYGACELCALQCRFLWWLWADRLTFSHTAQIAMDQTEIWLARLQARRAELDAAKRDFRGARVIVKNVPPRVTFH